MTKIGLFFGSTTGNSENAAKRIKDEFGSSAIVDVFGIENAKAEDIAKYEILILGTSTWGYGEPQDDWAGFESNLGRIDFKGKKVAFFGLGDQYGYADTFVDAMGMLCEIVKGRGAQIVGMTSTEGYSYDDSKAVLDGQFVGLALDDDNQSDMTADRIKQWVTQLKEELAI
jgi:flavodoxin I